MYFFFIDGFLFFFYSLHFTAASHNGVTSYHTPQGSQALPTSEADFVSDLSQGTNTTTSFFHNGNFASLSINHGEFFWCQSQLHGV